MNSYDVILFSETWLSKSEYTNLDIDGYSCDHIYGNKSRGTKKGRFSGGLSVYFKNCYRDKIQIVEEHQCGILCIKIRSDLLVCNEDVYICNIYIPPHGSKVLNNQDVDMYELLEQYVLRFKNLGKVYITGDFTSPVVQHLKQTLWTSINTSTIIPFMNFLMKLHLLRE